MSQLTANNPRFLKDAEAAIICECWLDPNMCEPGSDIREVTAAGLDTVDKMLKGCGWNMNNTAWVYTHDGPIRERLYEAKHTAPEVINSPSARICACVVTSHTSTQNIITNCWYKTTRRPQRPQVEGCRRYASHTEAEAASQEDRGKHVHESEMLHRKSTGNHTPYHTNRQ